MMLHTSDPGFSKLSTMKLEDFGMLQTRYRSMHIAIRAAAVLADAELALTTADRILAMMIEQPSTKKAFVSLRKNSPLIAKMRASEAKTLMLDSSSDYLETARHKLTAWRKTMERLAQGESIRQHGAEEYIPADAPIALALAGNASVSGCLSIIPLVLGEMARFDSKNADKYKLSLAEMRRCATVLSDYENASGLASIVH